jgi:hypothetical protein
MKTVASKRLTFPIAASAALGGLAARLILCLVLCAAAVGLSAKAEDHEPTFVTIDAPGAGTALYQGTVPMGLTPTGAITGYYIDASNVSHGFLRTSRGAFIAFDAPGAGAGE